MSKRTGLMLFVLIILAVILAACTAQNAMETPTATPTAQPSATARPTAVPTVTATPLSPDAQALKDIVFSDCIPVDDALPKGMEIPWNLLVMQDGDLYILNLEVDTKVKVPDFNERMNVDYYFHVSPDGKCLAYPGISGSKLIVEPAGTLLTNTDSDRIVLEKDRWFDLLRWVDNETVLVIYQKSKEDAFYPTIFLNPFTGEENVYSLEDMPNYMEQKFGGAVYVTHYMNGGELVPDPTLKKLIYPEQGDDGIFNTLWDIENEKPLARLKFLIGYINDPLWSQDGSDVLLMAPNQHKLGEWFLITSNGVVNQVTQFGEIFEEQYYEISHSGRSLDGQYLVFQLIYNQPDQIAKYVLLNLAASTLEGYCILPSSDYSYFGGSVWSPDNKFVIISGEDDDGKMDNIVVDVENETAYKIEQDMEVIGWIAKPEGEK